MRVVNNTQLAERNRRIATYLFFGTLAVLIGGFVFINYAVFTGQQPNILIFFAQLALLPSAFVLTLASVRITNNWARRPFPEDVFKEHIKGLNKKSIMYHYHHIPAWHVLIAPQGVFVIITRWHNGEFSVDNDQWKTHRGALMRIFSLLRMDGVGNPTRDALHAAEYLKKQLAPIAPDVDVQPLIVFIDPDVQIEIGDVSVPVLYATDKRKPNLTDYLRDLNQNDKDKQQKATLPLSQDQIEAFEAKTINT